MLYVESSRLNYNPREFIGLLGLGLPGIHYSGIGIKFLSPGFSPMRCLREGFQWRKREHSKNFTDATNWQ